MAEDKTMLLVLALVAMVAIVAAFGIVNMTGAMIGINQVPRVCEIYDDKCLVDAQIGVIDDPVLEEIKCQQCCALHYGCRMQLCKLDTISCLDEITLKQCMDNCESSANRWPIQDVYTIT